MRKETTNKPKKEPFLILTRTKFENKPRRRITNILKKNSQENSKDQKNTQTKNSNKASEAKHKENEHNTKIPATKCILQNCKQKQQRFKKTRERGKKKPHDQATCLGPTTARRFPRGRPGSRREGGSRRVQPDLGITLTVSSDLSSSSLRHGHYGGVRVHRCSRSGSPCGGATPRGLKRRRMKRKKLSPKKKEVKSQTRKQRKKLREKKTIRRRNPTCESSSSASRRSLCRAWRREIRLDSEESWEGQNQRRN